jgi:UDP-glucose 4-epimerase
MRQILVTGGSGFIGQAVSTCLAARGDQAKVFDRPQTILRAADIDFALAGCDGVINLAGVLGTQETLGHEHHAVRVNITGALNVYDAAARRGLPVVQIGTGHKGQQNPYAITKAAAEELGLARARYRNERIVIVRAYHAYGPGQKPSPPHGKGTVRKIVPSFVCRALTNMPLEVNGAGLQEIDLVHVSEVARVLVDALDADIPDGVVIEAGTGRRTSVLDAARMVIAAAKSDSRIAFKPMRDGEPFDSIVVAKDPACDRVWPYGLEETIEYYRGLLA